MLRVGCFFVLLFCSVLVFSQELFIKAQVMIESDRNQLVLSDFVENPQWLQDQGMADIIFGYSPMPGRSMKVSLQYIVSKFERYVEGFSFILPEAEVVVVYRQALSSVGLDHASETAVRDDKVGTDGYDSKVYDEKTVKNLILSAFEEKLEITFDERIIITYEAFPPTPLTGVIETINLYERASNKYMARIERVEGDGSKRYDTAVFTVKWPVLGVKVNKLIRKDVLLAQEYLVFEEIDFFDYDNPVLASQLPSDYVAAYNVSEAMILEWKMLRKRAYVLKGQIISAMVQIGGVTVISQVEMLGNAEMGQLAKAQNVDSRIIVTGIIEEGPLLRVTY